MPPIEREAILPRMDGIARNIKKLKELAMLPLAEFSTGDAYDLAQHHLRMALEGVFHIGAHILSRLPGARSKEYREIGQELGETGVVPQEFADRALVPMAKMRNLLVHQYADLDPKRMYDVCKNHLQDIEQYLGYISDLMSDPGRLGLGVE